MNDFQGKVIIITGASRGIGRAIAKSFYSQGARLILTAKENIDKLNDFPEAKKIKLDLSDSEAINQLVEEVVQEFRRIDVLVNNAGILRQKDFEFISARELDEMMNANFKGPFFLAQKTFSQMKKQKHGKIINIISGAAKLGSSRASHYASSKGALSSLTRSLAKLGGPYDIKVNAVAPGFIDTDMTADILAENRKQIESWIPLARVGQPEDVSGTVLFLAADKSDYITGQIVCVDGGQCML